LYNNEIYPIVTPFPSTVATDPNQYSFTIQNKPAPNQPYSMANVTSGTPGSAPLVYNANTVAIGHTYPAGSFTAPSLADLYNLGTAYSANGLCTRDYIFTAGGEEFALVITDPVAFNAFLASYPAAANLDAGTNSFIVGTPMYNYFESVRSYLLYPQMLSPENAYKYALAMVFLKFNAGVTLMRKDSGNTYEMIFGWEITWPNGGTTYSQLVCK
jgi:hypothetical protein